MRSKNSSSLFGRRLREARLSAAIPQDQLGVMIGLDEGTASARISRYETGVHEPPFDIAAKLAKTLCVPTAYFYCEDDDLALLIRRWQQLTADDRQVIKAMLNPA